MKKIRLVSVFVIALISLNACNGWDDGISIDINDPQHIETVQQIIDEDLLDVLNALSVQNGITYIHFGHTPPNLDDISFIVDTLWYDTCIKYRPDGVVSYINLGAENSEYKHHFYDHIENISHQKMHIHDKAHQNDYFADCDSTFIIGNGNNFTAYFKQTHPSEQQGNPTYAYLVSGTLTYKDTIIQNGNTFDTIKELYGVTNYRIAKKIVATNPDPAPYYCKGTLMVLRPYRQYDTIPFRTWDTLTGKHVASHRF